MSSAAVDMADYLEIAGHGTIGVNLFVAFEPAQPANCVTVYDTGGLPGDMTANFFRPTIQVRVRNVNYVAAHAALKLIHDDLFDILTLQQSDFYYFGCGSLTEPEPLGRDDQGRYILTQNFQVMREYASN